MRSNQALTAAADWRAIAEEWHQLAVMYRDLWKETDEELRDVTKTIRVAREEMAKLRAEDGTTPITLEGRVTDFCDWLRRTLEVGVRGAPDGIRDVLPAKVAAEAKNLLRSF